MPGTTTYDPDPIPLGRPPEAVLVYRYHGNAASLPEKWELLPNIRCLGVRGNDAGNPWSARFRYNFGDPLADPEDPRRLEDVYGYDSVGPRVVAADDRVVVVVVSPSGDHMLLFSGFVQAPQGDLTESGESATFLALGDTVRENDNPLAGALIRDADAPLNDLDVQTSLPVRFNPAGPDGVRANATPADADSGTDLTHPTFLGPFPEDTVKGEKLRPWTLVMAARYMIVRGRTDAKGSISPWVKIDNLDAIDDLLKAVRPAGEDDPDGNGPTGPIDADDPGTYTLEDIVVQDIDVTGMTWPAAVWRLIEPHGFGMAFFPDEGPQQDPSYPGEPGWRLDIFRKDFNARRKFLQLQKAGSGLDPARTNMQRLALARDASAVVNQVAVDTAPVRVEAGYVLAPDFQPQAGDKDHPEQFKKTEDDFTGATRDMYRRFIFDECGQGHYLWKQLTQTWDFDTTPGDFSPAFLMGRKDRNWALRLRPPLPDLVSTGDRGDRLRPTLLVSFNYEGVQPAVWNGTGTWQEVVGGGWKVMDDRCGIEVTAIDPDSWNAGDKEVNTLEQMAGGVIRLVQWMSPATTDLTPVFMLVCTLETDRGLNVLAPRRAASPTSFAVTRRLDAAERFRKEVVSKWSWYADVADWTVSDVTARDDHDEAEALADASRREHETATLAGPAVIPRFTVAYSIGDHITGVYGRGISLQSNAATEAGESPVYPCVCGIAWEFEGEQVTTLDLSDERAAPPPRRRGRKGRS